MTVATYPDDLHGYALGSFCDLPRVGEWAHVKYHERQHLIAAVEPNVDAVEPVRFACGKRYWPEAIAHDLPTPHLPRCRRCEAV